MKLCHEPAVQAQECSLVWGAAFQGQAQKASRVLTPVYWR
jgi:hypothetical protein